MSESQTLIGGYELRNCVASGASTQIWEVTQQGSTTPFAMKLLLPDSLKDAAIKNVLKHEFKVGASLEHPNIIRFHKIEITRDHGFFIMDYFRAPSLKAQISANLAETQSRFKKIVEAICQALVHLNEKGWLHRDIKPDNILVNKTGEVRLIDFSLAVRIASGIMKLMGGKQKSVMGTRTYIAPEIILKNPPTVQSDIYSLGVAFYEIVTGTPPFAGLNPNDLLKKHISETPAPPSIVNPNVTTELDAIILKMLSKKPKERPADMREVMSVFRSVRCFVEEPAELHDRKTKEAIANESLSVDKRLDSRADADRVSRGIAAPLKPKKGKRLTAPIGEMEAVKKTGAKAAAAPQNHPQAPGMPMMPGMMPQMPFGMMPGMAYPGMMMPQQMMPGMQPYQMGMPGQQPMMVPPQQFPPQEMPPMPGPAEPSAAHPSQKPVVQAPTAEPDVESASPPAREEPVRKILLPLERRLPKAASPDDPEVHADLDFMTELPDVS